MTHPGWVDPDAQDEPAGGTDDQREAADGVDTTVPGGEAVDLAEKPVLEWSNDDWKRWIEGSEGASLAATEAPGAAGGAEDVAPVEAAPEPAVGETDPVVVTAEPEFEPEPAFVAESGPDDVDATTPVEEDRVGAASDDEAQAPDSCETADLEERVPAGLWPQATVDEAPTEADPQDPPAAVAEAPDAVDADAGGGGGEWAGVSDHPWWESAPVLAPEPVVFDEDPPTSAEVAVPPVTPLAPERPPVRTTRAMPASASRPGSVIRPDPPLERSHRVRSAFGLVGVALAVGVVMAGLITVAIFAISLALRHAVG